MFVQRSFGAILFAPESTTLLHKELSWLSWMTVVSVTVHARCHRTEHNHSVHAAFCSEGQTAVGSDMCPSWVTCWWCHSCFHSKGIWDSHEWKESRMWVPWASPTSRSRALCILGWFCELHLSCVVTTLKMMKCSNTFGSSFCWSQINRRSILQRRPIVCDAQTKKAKNSISVLWQCVHEETEHTGHDDPQKQCFSDVEPIQMQFWQGSAQKWGDPWPPLRNAQSWPATLRLGDIRRRILWHSVESQPINVALLTNDNSSPKFDRKQGTKCSEQHLKKKLSYSDVSPKEQMLLHANSKVVNIALP